MLTNELRRQYLDKWCVNAIPRHRTHPWCGGAGPVFVTPYLQAGVRGRPSALPGVLRVAMTQLARVCVDGVGESLGGRGRAKR